MAACAGCGGSSPSATPEQDISNAPGTQAEVRVVADPSDPKTLLAASNDYGNGAMRWYTSQDGGRRWTTSAGLRIGSGCASDPAPAIGPNGREYLLLLRQRPCTERGRAEILAATRNGPATRWSIPREVAAPGQGVDEDRPDAAVDDGHRSPHRGRVYVIWVSFYGFLGNAVRLSWSDDGGRSWSTPSRVDAVGGFPAEPALAVGADGTVYAAWEDRGQNQVDLTRSVDGGRTFALPLEVGVALTIGNRHCRPGGDPIPAQPDRCVRPNPVVAVDDARRRVYVTYGTIADNRAQDVLVRGFDTRLRPLPGFATTERIGPPDGHHPADQFWAASAIDQSDGALWVCYYDTRGLPRQVAVYRCTASFDAGRTWARPVAAASQPSNLTLPGASTFEYGDFEGLAVADRVAHPTWTDGRRVRSLGEEIYTRGIRESALR